MLHGLGLTPSFRFRDLKDNNRPQIVLLILFDAAHRKKNEEKRNVITIIIPTTQALTGNATTVESGVCGCVCVREKERKREK